MENNFKSELSRFAWEMFESNPRENIGYLRLFIELEEGKDDFAYLNDGDLNDFNEDLDGDDGNKNGDDLEF